MASNYPPGVTGCEPEIIGDDYGERSYIVTVTVDVTASSPQEAGNHALDDLRDLGLGAWSVDVYEPATEKIETVETDGEVSRRFAPAPTQGAHQ